MCGETEFVILSRLPLTRVQILNFRRHAGHLNKRLPAHAESLRMAASAGLQDSVPRAALFSLHARVEGICPDSWEHPSLVQLWGPRFNDYVVAADDLAVFSLGRMPLEPSRHARAHETAARLHTFLQGQRMPFGKAGHAMGVSPNSLRYAAPTGTVLLRWDGARQPVIWTVPPPAVDPRHARLELARRFLHIFGPATFTAFARWAGIGLPAARAVFHDLTGECTPVHSPAGDAWILAADEAQFHMPQGPVAAARLLPSGDSFTLAWGADRHILVPDAERQAELWTSRVWPGALLVDGEIAGIWRRSASTVSVSPWRKLTAHQKDALAHEAASLPLPGLASPITFQWSELLNQPNL